MSDDKKDTIVLTDAEAELYDRQIRLWGVEAQTRLRAAKVLLAGLNGLGAEVGKNIILAGVKAITFLDDKPMTVLDTCSQFFAPKDQIGKNRAEISLSRAQNLNPGVKVSVDTSKIDDKPDSFFAEFDIVCVLECSITQIKKVNAACRKHGVKFFAGDVWGMFGCMFADLGTHEFLEDIVTSKKVPPPPGAEPGRKEKFEQITTSVKKTLTFVPFEKILNASNLPKDGESYYLFRILHNYREKYGRDPLPSERNSEALKAEVKLIVDEYKLEDKIDYLTSGDLYAQISPICAIVGGVLAQEIIKTISKKQTPHNNLFVFNPHTMCGKILCLGQD